MSYTPLNADDELDKYLFDTWNMKDTVHNRVLADSIKQWCKKHGLKARLDELERLRGEVKHESVHTTQELINSRQDKLKQELDRYE